MSKVVTMTSSMEALKALRAQMHELHTKHCALYERAMNLTTARSVYEDPEGRAALSLPRGEFEELQSSMESELSATWAEHERLRAIFARETRHLPERVVREMAWGVIAASRANAV